jgi:4-alpha-glucanotransferase
MGSTALCRGKRCRAGRSDQADHFVAGVYDAPKLSLHERSSEWDARAVSTSENAVIELLSDAVGIEPTYRDVDGRVQSVAIETQRAVLHSMGVDVSTPEAARAALQARVEAEWRFLLPPAIVLKHAPEVIPAVSLTLPEPYLSRRLEWHLDLEEGTGLSGSIQPEGLAELARSRVDGRPFVRVQMPLPLGLDEGYHRLTVRTPHAEATTTLVLARPRAFIPDWLEHGERRWGIAAPLFSLWSEASWGIGDFSDLSRLVDVAHALGAHTVGLNPLHVPMAGTSFDPNPYLPSSRLFLNPMFIDVTTACALADSRAELAFDRDPGFADGLRRARDAKFVDYPLVYQLKNDALETIYRSRKWEYPNQHIELPVGPTGPLAEFAAFRRKHGGALRRFAVFNALQERFGALPWREWPMDVRTPDSAGIGDFERECRERIDYHAWLQWIADQQLAGAGKIAADNDGTGLYRDLAVGIHRDGADAWADPEVYLAGASVGAPPDAFNPDGQNWGIPPPSPLALRGSRYAPFVAAVRANMQHAKILRIDHVMGLQRLYWVPQGHPARSGAYIRYPVDDLLGIVALESRRSGCLIIGEDLGTLPDGFHERLAEASIMSTRLMMFERYPNGLFRRPGTYPRLAAVSFGTHDLPTIRSWLEGRDIKLRQSLGLCSEPAAEQECARRREDGALLFAALSDQQLTAGSDLDLNAISDLITAIEQFLARSSSALVLANLSDMLAETEQINLPGTVSEHANWRHRFGLPVSALSSTALARRIALAIATERSGATAPG